MYSGQHLGDQPWWETGTETALKWNNCSRGWCIFCKHLYVTRVLRKWFELLVFQTFGRNHQGMWECYICSWLRTAFRRTFLLAFSKSHLLLCKVWSFLPGTLSWFLMLLSFHFEFHYRFRKLHPIIRVLCKGACSVSERRKLAEFPWGWWSYYFLFVELILLGAIQFF